MAASSRLRATLLAMVATAGWPAQAQQADGSLGIELNALHPSQGGCRLSFVVSNGFAADIEKVAYEMVLFDAAGLIERMTVLDFRDIPTGKTRVRQFDLSGADCARISRVLVNDAKTCTGPGLEPTACMRRLEPASKTAVPLSG